MAHHFLAKTQFTHEKVLFTYKLWPTPLPTNIVTPNRLYTSLPAPMYICAHCFFFVFCFNLLFQLHVILLSGSRAARLLFNWLIDWLPSTAVFFFYGRYRDSKSSARPSTAAERVRAQAASVSISSAQRSIWRGCLYAKRRRRRALKKITVP